MIDWILAAGLRFERLVEPRAQPPERRRDPEATPYWSPLWEEMAGQLRKIPVVAIYLAGRPEK